MPRHLPVRDVRRLGVTALEKGATPVNPLRTEWNLAGNCEAPHYVEKTGRPEIRSKRLHPETIEDAVQIFRDMHLNVGTYTLMIWVRCRRCKPCLRHRQLRWMNLAKNELAVASRTWFGTLTLAPGAHALMGYRAGARLKLRGTEFLELSAEEQFGERHRECSIEITRWLKRIRKESGAKLRYLLVVEEHTKELAGLPHYHMLVHEVGPSQVFERTLRKQWKLGFSQFKLVDGDSKTAWYVTKYLTKSVLARVRASQYYGRLRSQSIETKRIVF